VALGDGASTENAGGVCMQLEGWEAWGLDVSETQTDDLPETEMMSVDLLCLPLCQGCVPKYLVTKMMGRTISRWS